MKARATSAEMWWTAFLLAQTLLNVAAFSSPGCVPSGQIVTFSKTMPGGWKRCRNPPLLAEKQEYFEYDEIKNIMDQQNHLQLPFSVPNVPAQVSNALVFYKLYGKVGLRVVCDNYSDLCLKQRSNVTIIEHETEGRRFEYQLYGEDKDHQNLEQVVSQERREIPFSWKNLRKVMLNNVFISVLGIVASRVFSVPVLGFGDNFSLNVCSAATAAFRWLETIMWSMITSMSQSTQLIPNLIIAALAVGFLGWFVMADIDDDLVDTNDSDDNWVDTNDSVSAPSLRLVLAIMGNRFRPLKAMLVSAAMGLAPGIGEEIAFRGVLQTVLARRLSTPQAVVVQAILFSLGHRGSGPYMISSGLVGLLLGIIYAATQNLAIPIFLHVFSNIFNTFWGHVYVTDMTEEEINKLLQGPSRDVVDTQ